MIPMNFWSDTRAGATAIVAVAVTVMTVGAAALITDHVAVVDQRDTLKAASSSAAIAATQAMHRVLEDDREINDEDLKAVLVQVVQDYVAINLRHLPKDRYERAIKTLVVDVQPNRGQGTVGVSATADLGGFLFAGRLPLLGGVKPIETVSVMSRVEGTTNPVEVVLAIDISGSMSRDLEGKHAGQSRMSIVKKAARQLVDILNPTGENQVAVGVVPWTFKVRLNQATAQKWRVNNWARYPTERTYPVPYTCNACTITASVDTLPAAPPSAWLGCFDGHRMDSGTATLPAISVRGLFEPPSTTPFAQSYFQPIHGGSYRCQTTSELPSGASHTCWEPHPQLAQEGCRATRTIFPLSSNRPDIESAIDFLSPGGGFTYSALGILWGQRLLLHLWQPVWGGTVHPMDPEAESNEGLRKVIVLLTDGQDSYCGFRNEACEGTPHAISRTDACAQAKAAGTEIFVIAAMHPDKVSGDLASTLRKCSSESDHPEGTYVFLNNSTPERLSAAFSNIAGQLKGVRRAY